MGRGESAPRVFNYQVVMAIVRMKNRNRLVFETKQALTSYTFTEEVCGRLGSSRMIDDHINDNIIKDRRSRHR